MTTKDTQKVTTITSIVAILSGIGIVAAAAQDRDGVFADGVLTRAEASEQALTRFDRQDANGDGFVSDIEQAQAREAAEARLADRGGDRRGQRGQRGRRGADRLDLIDDDDDGFVSRDEALEAALTVFDEADTDGDGELRRKELRARRDARRKNARG